MEKNHAGCADKLDTYMSDFDEGVQVNIPKTMVTQMKDSIGWS